MCVPADATDDLLEPVNLASRARPGRDGPARSSSVRDDWTRRLTQSGRQPDLELRCGHLPATATGSVGIMIDYRDAGGPGGALKSLCRNKRPKAVTVTVLQLRTSSSVRPNFKFRRLVLQARVKHPTQLNLIPGTVTFKFVATRTLQGF
jgi:hypothetical protein